MRCKVIGSILCVVFLGGCMNTAPYQNPFDSFYANLTPETVETAPITDETQQASYKFASDLLQQLDKPGENLFFSPISLMVTLGMALNGASGETHRQMVQVLGYAPDQFDEKQFNQQMHSLLHLLETAGEGVTLHRANGVWVDQSIEPNPDFLRTVLSYYGSRVFATDFQNNPRRSVRDINRWVALQTNSRIPALLAPSDIDELATITLVNALYLDAKWEKPFSPEKTENAPFYLEDGGTRTVPMMDNDGIFPYLRGEGFQAVGLPYRRSYAQDAPRFVFYLFVPDKDRTVAWLREQWTSENWAKWCRAFEEAEGEVKMPRFSMDGNYYLREALQALGMTHAFDQERADFQRMTARETDLVIGQVVQKATLELDEQGVRATAGGGTGVEAATSAPPPEPFSVVADRPFLFVIAHEQTGVVLFVGIVREP